MKFFTLKEIAGMTKIPYAQICDYARRNIIPATKFGRVYRVEESRFLEWTRGGGQALPGGWKRQP